MALDYVKVKSKRLRDLGFDEKWLQDRIDHDPSLLGLGDLDVIKREYAQPTGGRIDFLMYDSDEEVRYEIEVMLGRLDETHIIRTIEYWDIERRRFPDIQHRAVIVAEEITHRFFNIVSLLNRAVPIIAIQLSAFEIDGRVALHFTTVLDLPEPVAEDDGEKVDRAFWEKRSNPGAMAVADRMIGLVPGGAVRTTYNKGHIAVGTSGSNFCWFHPRKSASHCHIELRLDGDARTDVLGKLEEAGIFSGPRGTGFMKMRLNETELATREKLIAEVLAKCEERSRE